MLRLPIALPRNRRFQGSHPTQLSLDETAFIPHQTEVTDSALKAFPSNTRLEFLSLLFSACVPGKGIKFSSCEAQMKASEWCCPSLGLCWQQEADRSGRVENALGFCCVCVYSFKGGKEKQERRSGVGKSLL